MSNHESFNDPFDLGAHILFKGSKEEKRTRFKTLIAERSGLPWKKRRDQLDQFMARPEEEWDAALKMIYKKNAKDIGIFSFAGTRKAS